MKTALTAAVVSAIVAAASGTAATIVVTSKNIKNGTIQTVDISAKAKRALKGNRGARGLRGPTGAQGAQGTPGATGQPGQTGPSGARGPSAAFYRTVASVPLPHATFPPSDFVTVAELEVEPGSYLVWAKLWVNNLGTDSGLGYCFLFGPGGPADQTLTTIEAPPPSGLGQGEAMALNIAATPEEAGTIVLECIDNTLATFSNSALTARDVVLSAIQVGSVTEQ